MDHPDSCSPSDADKHESSTLSEVSQSERQIPCDLASMWNLMNKINWWTREKQRCGHVEQTDSCQRGGAGGTGWKKGKRLAKEQMCMTHGHRQPWWLEGICMSMLTGARWPFIVLLFCISLMASDVDHLFRYTGHLHVFFGEVSIQVLCPFLNWIVRSFGVEFYKLFINFGH